ncbi:MAG: hypothetical protein PHW77_05990, partial [Eubacteriales bacterium]|nr:hypothetical protein [Eubacteriales bacterium]
FGEGGAGAFSDGKLTTLIKDENLRCRFVLETFVRYGAPEEILYEAHPHIGTDKLRCVIKNIRNDIISLGGEFRFGCRFIGYETDGNNIYAALFEASSGMYKTDADTIFLAIGHSARDTFETLYKNGVMMERKPFSVGVRIEHLQKDINLARYHADASSLGLPAAEYKISAHTKNGRILYSFCMCPGGSVVAAASEKNGLVTNGMSVHARDGENANNALLVSVQPGDIQGEGPLAGMYFQRELERKAFIYGGGSYKAPAQTVGDFLDGRVTTIFGKVCPSYPRGVTGTDLRTLLPYFVYETLTEGIPLLDRQITGFASPDAVLTGVESRSTCPVRILRDKSTLCAGIQGLYPAGEGAGYAGGIMSAAADGIKVAEAWMTTETRI